MLQLETHKALSWLQSGWKVGVLLGPTSSHLLRPRIPPPLQKDKKRAGGGQNLMFSPNRFG